MRETWEDLDRIQYIEYEAETVFDYNNLDSDLYIQEYMNRFSAQIFEAKKYSDDTWNNLDVLWTTYSPSWEHTLLASYAYSLSLFVRCKPPKKVLVDLLRDDIKVYEDDGSTEVPGIASAAWYDKAAFKDHGWQVSVGPTIDADAKVMDLGAEHKDYDEDIQVTVWVLEKRDVSYTPERLRSDLVNEVDRILHDNVDLQIPCYDHVNASSWSDLDEGENKILRSDTRVNLEYIKTKDS
jgi:hypothetical protein